MKRPALVLLALCPVMCSFGAQAQTIYQFDRTVGEGTVTGFIETDGKIGQIGPDNILSWSFETDDGLSEPPPAHGPITISSATGGGKLGDAWNYLSATETELSFDFDGAYADGDVYGIEFNGGGVGFSVSYALVGDANVDAKHEHLVHFFDDPVFGQAHFVRTPQAGVVVVGTTDSVELKGYNYELLDYPGLPTQVFGISEKGDVVGNGIGDSTAFPFVYSANQDVLESVPPAAGYLGTSVVDISSKGVMVGAVTAPTGERSGFVRNMHGNFTIFDHPGDDVGDVCMTLPRGVNTNGLVSGYYRYCEPGLGTSGFIYDSKRETFTNIVPSQFTIAHGINAKGDVVGNAVFSDDDDLCNSPASNRYGWLRTADGTVTYFQVNGQRTDARGINDAGYIVGGFIDANSGTFKGFRVKLNGTSSCESVTVDEKDMLDFPGYRNTIPEGISNSGVVVGIAVDELGNHGFIARPK